MMKTLIFVLALLAFSFSGVKAQIVVREDGSLLVPNENGFLESWSEGKATPNWRYPLRGTGVGARSLVADLAELQSGGILILERFGDVVRLDSAGQEMLRKPPIYGTFKIANLSSNFVDWHEHITKRPYTSAAHILAATDTLLLSQNLITSVVDVPLSGLISSDIDNLVLTDSWYLLDDLSSLASSVSHKEPTLKVRNTWSMRDDPGEEVSALGICSGRLIVGHNDGTLTFQTYPDSFEEQMRIRHVHADDQQTRSILDIGCLTDKLAYSVTWQSQDHGQVQLWDIQTATLVDSFGIETNGHPLIAHTAVGSKDGDQLLTLGDGDVRLWNIKNQKFEFVKAFYLGSTSSRSYSAAPYRNQGFIYWDGQNIWNILPDGSKPSILAGPNIRQ